VSTEQHSILAKDAHEQATRDIGPEIGVGDERARVYCERLESYTSKHAEDGEENQVRNDVQLGEPFRRRRLVWIVLGTMMAAVCFQAFMSVTAPLVRILIRCWCCKFVKAKLFFLQCVVAMVHGAVTLCFQAFMSVSVTALLVRILIRCWCCKFVKANLFFLQCIVAMGYGAVSGQVTTAGSSFTL
jgi:hypothetical protein